LEFLKSEYLLASGSWDGEIKLWNLTTSLVVRTFYGHFSTVNDILYLEKSLFASCSLDYTVKIWNLEKGEKSKTLFHSDEVKSLVLLRNGLLASCSDDTTIGVWNYTIGELVKILTDHTDRLTSMVILQNGYLASACSDGIPSANFALGIYRLFLNIQTDLISYPIKIFNFFRISALQ
jgi:WD40 repeat protein